MTRSENQRKALSSFSRVLLLSLLFHGGVAGLILMSWEGQVQPEERQVVVQLVQKNKDVKKPQEPSQKKSELPLQQREEPSKPVEEDQHAPTHNAEEFASNNQDAEVQGEVVAGGGLDSKKESLNKALDADRQKETKAQSELAQQTESESAQEDRDNQLTASERQSVVDHTIVTEGESFTISERQADEAVIGDELSELAAAMGLQGGNPFEIEVEPSPEELEIPDEYLDGYGNLKLLSEGELADALVEQPFSEKESKELQLVNRYLERMNKQVLAFWINPYQGNKMLRGIIKLELHANGNLKHAYIFRSSGHSLLDISVLDAIRAVPRFEVPENKIIAEQYYTNLSFHYTSIEEETELMPFEVAAKKVVNEGSKDILN